MVDRRLPGWPSNEEAERALLGALMLDEKAWPRIDGSVSERDFVRADHRVVFAAIRRVADRSKNVDAIAVLDHLQQAGQLDAAGGRDYVARLVSESPSAANVGGYAKLLREKTSLRRLRQVGAEIIELVNGEDGRSPTDLIADVEHRLLELHAESRFGRGLVPSGELARNLMDDLARRAEGARGLSVGLADFDELTNGLDPGDLVVIAGRPGLGKSAWLVTVATHIAQSTGVAVFSAEMPALQLMRRCVALLSNISQGHLRHVEHLAECDWAEIAEAVSSVAHRQLWIDDTPSPAREHVRAETLALKARVPLGLVLVDYAQLVQGRGANRYEQLRDVAYGLKDLAKEAAVPVILLGQLNRKAEGREQKRPLLSDLRDSGAIEEAADIVGLLFSEGYYDPTVEMPSVLECQVAKNRNGERGECYWRFEGEYSRITVLDEASGILYRKQRDRRRRATDDL